MISTGQIQPPSDMNSILQDSFFKFRKQVIEEMMSTKGLTNDSFSEIVDALLYRILMEKVI